MRRLFACLVVVAVFGGVGLAMPLCDYRSPQTDLTDLGLGFSYHYRNDPYGQADKDVNTGVLKLSYNRLFDSPDFGYDATGTSDVSISLPDAFSAETNVDGNFKLYLASKSPFFGFAGTNAKTSSAYQQTGLSLRLGIGYGRFVDVTPLAKAMKIDALLADRGSLAGPSHPKDVEAMAYEIDSMASFASLADLLAVLADILETAGQTKAGGLDALDLYEMGRVVGDAAYKRYCGGEVKLGLAYELLDPMLGANDLLATVDFAYAFTTTPQAQFLVRGKLSGSYDILETYQFGVDMTYDYLLSDQLGVTSSYSFSREMWAGEPTDAHRFSVSVTFTPAEAARFSIEAAFERLPFYLEWKADINVQIGVSLL